MKRKGPQPKAVVLECMAVSPDLIEFLSSRIVKPDVVVITNALWDHLEEEGTSLEGIATSLSLALPGAKLMVTSEHRETTRAVLSYEASLRGVTADMGRSGSDVIRTFIGTGAAALILAALLWVTESFGLLVGIGALGLVALGSIPGILALREPWRQAELSGKSRLVELGRDTGSVRPPA